MPSLKKIPLLITLTLLTTLLSSCSFFTPYKATITQGTIITPEETDYLQAGLTMEQVQELLGPPFGNDPFDPKHWEYVFYSTDKAIHPEAIHHLIIKFDNDYYLESWHIVKDDIIIKRSFF